jgi:hypothetical protein
MNIDGQVNTQVANSSPTGGAGWSSALTTSFYGTTFSYANTTGVVTLTAGAGTSGCGISINGLTLGWHTITINWTSGTGSINTEAFDIITPVHSHRSSLYADLQNALPVGSSAISDDRLFTPVAGLPGSKAWAQALGVTSSPTTASVSLLPCPDMSCAVKTAGGALRISYSLFTSSAGGATVTQVYVDGIPIGNAKENSNSATAGTVSDVIIVPVSAGFHKVDLYWASSAGSTQTASGTSRSLVVEER